MKNSYIILCVLLTLGVLVGSCSTETAVPTQSPSPTRTPTASPTATELPTSTPFSASGVQVTFYDLSGFMVQIGDQKILIDALFGWFPRYDPPQEAYERIIAPEPPFDDIDLVLITHDHPDHFSAGVVGTYLQENPGTALVSTAQVVSSIRATGIELVNPIYAVNISAGERETISLEGIEIECLFISHGIPDFLNLGFIVTVDQVSFFHSGDLSTEDVSVADLVAYQIPDRGLDLAFIPISLLTVEAFHPYIFEGIQARYLIPTHYTYSDPRTSLEYFPDAVLFSDSMETWQMP